MQYRRHLRKTHLTSSGFPSTISEHNFQASSGTRASSNLACNIASTSATVDNTKKSDHF